MGLRDLFGRRLPRLPEHVEDSPLDWAAGDIAVCNARGCWVELGGPRGSSGPAFGEHCRVREVIIYEARQFLRLPGYEGIFAASDFSKLDGNKASFERMVRDCKPAPVREPEHA